LRSGDAPAAPGHALIDDYATWAPSVDAFVPVEVTADIEVNIPDPVLSDRALATTVGEPVRFVTQLDGLVFGEDYRPWVLCHRLVHGPFVDSDLLSLDDTALADCWAWREWSLDSRMAGVIFNEIGLDGEDGFRRTTVPVTAAEVTLVGRHLALEAFDMLDASLALYPNPSLEHCGICPFRHPCRAIQEGDDPPADPCLGLPPPPQPTARPRTPRRSDLEHEPGSPPAPFRTLWRRCRPPARPLNAPVGGPCRYGPEDGCTVTDPAD
jgi:hypothetical protein